MKHLMRFSLTLLCVVAFYSAAFANPLSPTPILLPNVFDGYSVLLSAPDAGGACGVTYGQDITVTYTDGTVPNSGALTTCDGTAINQTNGQIVVTRDTNTGFWCFRGSQTAYKITYSGQTTPFIWFANSSGTGFYNVKDFGALGDGTADDTFAIKNAIAFIAAKHGGTLFFPHGDYIVGGTDLDFKGFTLPSGIVIEGASSLPSVPLANYFGDRKNSTRIRVKTLTGRTAARIFRIGECTQRVAIRNIELKSDLANTVTTYGIEAIGKKYNAGNPNANPPTYPTGIPSEDMLFENLSISDFKIGLYVHDVSVSDHAWQFDYVEVRHCRFNNNSEAGISIVTADSDWKIDHCVFDLPTATSSIKADGISITDGGTITIINTFAGASGSGAGGTFIHTYYPGSMTIMNSQCEHVTKSLVYGDVLPPATTNSGDASYPLTLINNIFGLTVDLKAPCTFVSTGNLYAHNTVQTVAGVRIYSTGDRFCYDWRINGCLDPVTNQPVNDAGGFQGDGIVVFRSGQPRDRAPSTGEEAYVKHVPTTFGFDVEMRASDTTATDSADTALLSIFSPPSFALSGYTTQKPLLRIGAPGGYYDVTRTTLGILNFQSGPGTTPTLTPYRGFSFDRPVRLPSYTRSQLADSNMTNYLYTMGVGTMVFCTDCAHGTSPCTAGDGTIAVLNYVSGVIRWQCQ